MESKEKVWSSLALSGGAAGTVPCRRSADGDAGIVYGYYATAVQRDGSEAECNQGDTSIMLPRRMNAPL